MSYTYGTNRISKETLAQIYIWDGSFNTAKAICGETFVVDVDLCLMVGGANDIMWAPIGDTIFKIGDDAYSCQELIAISEIEHMSKGWDAKYWPAPKRNTN